MGGCFATQFRLCEWRHNVWWPNSAILSENGFRHKYFQHPHRAVCYSPLTCLQNIWVGSHWGQRGASKRERMGVYLPEFWAQVWQLGRWAGDSHECSAQGHKEETSDPSHLRPEYPPWGWWWWFAAHSDFVPGPGREENREEKQKNEMDFTFLSAWLDWRQNSSWS